MAPHTTAQSCWPAALSQSLGVQGPVNTPQRNFSFFGYAFKVRLGTLHAVFCGSAWSGVACSAACGDSYVVHTTCAQDNSDDTTFLHGPLLTLAAGKTHHVLLTNELTLTPGEAALVRSARQPGRRAC